MRFEACAYLGHVQHAARQQARLSGTCDKSVIPKTLQDWGRPLPAASARQAFL
jgi:hypothetical protein